VMQKLNLQPINLPGVPIRIFTWAVKNLARSLSQPFIARIAGSGRGEKMPSLHIDLHAGRGKSEVDFLNGAVVRFGDLTGTPTPINKWLNHTLLDLVHGVLPVDEYSHKPEKLLRVLYLDQDFD
jgi:2-dehydropantoate 2-reductase